MSSEALKLGTYTHWGEVVGILWLGERYYFLIRGGVVSLMPAATVEESLCKLP